MYSLGSNSNPEDRTMKGIHIAYLLLIALLTVQLACSSHSDSDDEGADAGDTHSGDTGASDTPPDPRIGGDGDNPSDLGDAGNTEDGGGGDRGETVDIPVTPDDVKAVAPSVLPHRMILSSAARLAGSTGRTLVSDILSSVPVPIER